MSLEKNKAIPKGYMTVGEIAKKMGITVRALQYYDREGLLAPSAESPGGRRLYTDRDLIKLHQILSLKHLGFSLGDIKSRLIPLESPEAVAEMLENQADDVRARIEALEEILTEIELLRQEVLQIQSVDFKKYADIIVNLQMKNEHYHLIKHFDDKTLDHIRSRFDKDSGLEFMEKFTVISSEVLMKQKAGISPGSDEGQEIAKRFWDMITEFTGGDVSLLPNLMKVGDIANEDSEQGQNQALINKFIGPALDIYLEKLGLNPFEGESK